MYCIFCIVTWASTFATLSATSVFGRSVITNIGIRTEISDPIPIVTAKASRFLRYLLEGSTFLEDEMVSSKISTDCCSRLASLFVPP